MKRPLHRCLGGCRLAGLASLCLAACFGKITEKQSSAPPPQDEPVVLRAFVAAPLGARALLSWQYRNAIQDLLGPAAAAAVNPPPDTTVNGWDAIGAAQLSLSATAVDMYEASAQRAAGIAMDDVERRDSLLGCAPGRTDQECLTSFVARFGRRAWRRPLSLDERTAWASVGAAAAEAYGDRYKGAAFVIAGLLQSPNFLYQVEIGEDDPDNPGRPRLTGYELATRLSFFLTGSTPSEELTAAAERGELHSQDGVRIWARALLDGPRSRDAVGRLFDELLQLRDLLQLSKDPIAFPSFNRALAVAMGDETRHLLDSLIWGEGGDFRQFFDSDYTFVNRDLAALYGLPDPPPSGFVRASLPQESRRGGFLGQASFLALMAHPSTSSPTLRGKFIREKLLCQNIPPPPPNVDTTLPSTEGITTRQRLLAHRQNPSCASCHALMDDIGLGLENFDAIGRYRTTDSGQPIDASSALDDLGSFAGARELGALLRAERRVTECLARNLFRAATGHVDTLGESGPLYLAHASFAASGYQLKELLVEIAASDAFRFGAVQERSAP